MRRARLPAIAVAGLFLGIGAAACLDAAQPTERAAAEAFHAGRYDEAISLYAALATRSPQSPEAARGLVAALREVGRYDDAIAAAERFIRGSPGSPELWTPLGETLRIRGRLAQAESAFARAVAGRASDTLTARLNLGILALERGAHTEARRDLDAFIDVYNRAVDRGARLSSADLLAVATAVRHQATFDPQLAKDALRAYDEATAADSMDWEPRLAVGELFLEKYNGTDARRTFEQVLARNPRHPRALLGLARTAHFEGSPEAEELARKSLEVNPHLMAARIFLAQLAAEGEAYEEAAAAAERALAVNPASLEALAVLAGVRYLEGDTLRFEDARRRALALNPSYAGLYVTLAELSARGRLYEEAVRFGERAVALDSTAWRAHAVLGINRLRVGAMAEGRAGLETAFRGDPYDVWTKNTLDLLDDLDRYPETATPRFRFYSDGKESELLSLYAGELAEAAYDALARRYGYSPATPIRIEIFPNHADFSVRTVGLVGLGALGVSFGPVIAMDSPSAREAGEFHWGSTLWHELAHTFHLGMTGARVSRWFTEGLAVHEERRARHGWGEGVTPAFLQAYRAGRLRKLPELNDGFVRPAYPEQIAFSYYQASLVCELIERELGTRALLDLLAAYGQGKSTQEAFRTVLGTDPDAFERRFERYLEERFAGPLAALAASDAAWPARPEREEVARRAKNPQDFRAQLAMGRILVEEERYDDAVSYLERAKALFPSYAGPEGPYPLLARIHKARGATRQAAHELTTLVALDARHYGALLELAGLLDTLGDTLGAADALERAVQVYPLDPEPHVRLAGLYERLERWDRAVRERRAVVALDPGDRADAWYRLGRAYHRAGDAESARRWVLRALEVAPAFREAQELLLEIHDARRR
ncbi:MAG: tetratricopeptide repeat protein [Gemmatimonadetes bacterium]|nr:tetratricopeptide repeat protein [Gemmatimonadota bacterium]